MMRENSWRKLLQKYLEGTCSEKERQVVERYYESLDHRPEEPRLVIWREVEEELWEKIHRKAGLSGTNQGAGEKRFTLRTGRWVWGGMAACVALAIGLFLILYEPVLSNQGREEIAAPTSLERAIPLQREALQEQEEVVNSYGLTKVCTLPDGSLATLHPGSQIRFLAQAAAGNREVSMVGEVFFEVKPNPDRPFLVYAGGVVTKVLGTSFTVKTQPEGQEVEVAVRSGKVAVQIEGRSEFPDGRRTQDKGVVLTPNQKVHFMQGKKALVVGLVDNPLMLIGQEAAGELFVYQDTPLVTVVNAIGKAYGVEIVASANLLACPITANFMQEDLYTKLQLICEVLEAKYYIEGTRINLVGSGCDG